MHSHWPASEAGASALGYAPVAPESGFEPLTFALTGRRTAYRAARECGGLTRNRTETYALQAHRAGRYHYEPVASAERIELPAAWFVATRVIQNVAE